MTSSHGGKKMWCVPELDDAYIERMEDVLDVYEKPINEKEPVVCLDEKPIQLLSDKRKGTAAKPGKVAQKDYEYVREGTANVFCAVEPKVGRHFEYVTENRKGSEFAKVINRLSKKYPEANTIHLVIDNLNTHTQKSLTDFYGKEKGCQLWNRFTVHYTPKHASWLNQAEIEISLYSKQCLGKDRIPDIQLLRSRTNAWNKQVNKKRIKISWKFTKEKAKEKFQYN